MKSSAQLRGKKTDMQRVGWFNLKNAAGWKYLFQSSDLYPQVSVIKCPMKKTWQDDGNSGKHWKSKQYGMAGREKLY